MPEIDFDFGDDVEEPTFAQILEMDEDDDKEFSKSIVFGFLEQAEQTFGSMEKYIKEENLLELSKLGHFLKGSSATLGFNKVRDECEKIQNYGADKDETGEKPQPDKAKSLKSIQTSLEEAKKAYEAVKGHMQNFYNESA